MERYIDPGKENAWRLTGRIREWKQDKIREHTRGK
jgi:hypothetical protein